MSQDINMIGILAERVTGLTEEETLFVGRFGYKTGDKELTDKLLQELGEEGHDFKAVCQRYSLLADFKPNWVEQAENLLIALEMYRIEEAKAINRLSDILGAYGIAVSEEEMKIMDTTEIKERVREKAFL